MTSYEVVIGLEIHVQLKTDSKMFCLSSADYFGNKPNTHTCPTCLALPGALPVVNKKAVENSIKVGLALNCIINKSNKFDRKSYFYPDLAKGYQISQFDQPININGWILVGEKKVRINRAHMEEDTGKLIHSNVSNKKVSLIDFNRSGVPLLEIVSEPDISSAEEAKNYAKKIHQIMRYLGVADVDMEKAGMRFDANVSIKPEGQKELGTKVEIKNINSFNYLEKAIVYEIVRQKKAKENGEEIIQETRGWVEAKGETVFQRSKETSPDYRYFPDPDLPPLGFNEQEIAALSKSLPEMPDIKKKRFETDYSLGSYEALLLTEEKDLADWYEEALRVYAKTSRAKADAAKAKKVANWVINQVGAYLNENNIKIDKVNAVPADLAELLDQLDKDKLNNQTAKKVFEEVLRTGEKPTEVLNRLGIAQLSSSTLIEPSVDRVIANNKKAFEDNALEFLLGQVMRETKGTANPQTVREILERKMKKPK